MGGMFTQHFLLQRKSWWDSTCITCPAWLLTSRLLNSRICQHYFKKEAFFFFQGPAVQSKCKTLSAPACAKATWRDCARTDSNSTIIQVQYHGNVWIFMPPRAVRRADKGGRSGARCLLHSPAHVHYARMFSSFTSTFPPHQVLRFTRSKSWIY